MVRVLWLVPRVGHVARDVGRECLGGAAGRGPVETVDDHEATGHMVRDVRVSGRQTAA